MRTIRLFKILDYLRTLRRPVSAERLSEKFEVSLRTIYRDMSVLQELGAPIRGEGGIGYQIEAGFFMPPLHFDENEMDALALGMRLASARSDPTLSFAAKSVSAKIGAVLPEGLKEKFLDLPYHAVSKNQNSFPVSEKFSSDIRLALRTRKKLDVTYMSLSGQSSQRILHPLGLTIFDDAWILTAWCETRQDFRNFRLDQFQSLELTDQYFHLTPGRTFEDFIKTI